MHDVPAATGIILTQRTVGITALWVYRVEKDHAEHEAHLKHENDGKLPEPPAYEYLNIRRTSSCPRFLKYN